MRQRAAAELRCDTAPTAYRSGEAMKAFDPDADIRRG
jgi:hypothetical protein